MQSIYWFYIGLLNCDPRVNDTRMSSCCICDKFIVYRSRIVLLVLIYSTSCVVVTGLI